MIASTSVMAANLFIFLDVHRPWRKVKVTDSVPPSTSLPACRSW
jgi:hypothetical protein